MADSDRKKIKDEQKGVFGVIAGIVDPGGEVGRMNEETFTFDAGAASGDIAERGIYFDKDCIVKHVEELPSEALANDGTDAAIVTRTIQKRDGAGGAPVSVATLGTGTVGGAALLAFQKTTFKLSAVPANLKISKGNVLTFKSAKTGAPACPTESNVSVTVEYV